MGLHYILQHLDSPGIYTRILFWTLAQHSMASSQKSSALSAPTCQWITNFLTSHLTILNRSVSAVESFRLWGSTISQDLKKASNIESIIEKAQQRMWFLCQLRKFNLPQELLIQFYTAIIQSALCTSITVWFGSATKQDRNTPQCTDRTAEKNPWCQTSLQIHHTLDTTCSNFSPLVGAKDAKTTRHKNSFFLQAITLTQLTSVI